VGGHVVHEAALLVVENLPTAHCVQTVSAVLLQLIWREEPGPQTVQFEQLVAPPAAAHVPPAQLLHTLFVVAEHTELRNLPPAQLDDAQAAQAA